MRYKKAPKLSYLLPFLLLLTACGFQLRGVNAKLPERFSATYLYMDAAVYDAALMAQMRRQIQANNGDIVEESEAMTRVKVSPVRQSERQVAISSDGYLKEYETTYRMTVSVYDAENNLLLGQRDIATTRYTQRDERQILSSEEQRDVVKDQAMRELSYQAISFLLSIR